MTPPPGYRVIAGHLIDPRARKRVRVGEITCDNPPLGGDAAPGAPPGTRGVLSGRRCHTIAGDRS